MLSLAPNWNTVTAFCMVFLIKKSQSFNIYRIQPLDWLQKLGSRITSRLFFVNSTGSLYTNASSSRFSILLITYDTVLNGLAAKYLTDPLSLHNPTRLLRSNANHNLRLYRPTFRTENYGDRPFPSCAPMLWNELPFDVRNVPSTQAFKERLKTFLFNS